VLRAQLRMLDVSPINLTPVFPRLYYYRCPEVGNVIRLVRATQS
jgi:hypothetical protein